MGGKKPRMNGIFTAAPSSLNNSICALLLLRDAFTTVPKIHRSIFQFLTKFSRTSPLAAILTWTRKGVLAFLQDGYRF